MIFELVSFLFFAFKRLKRYLHFYQQDEYDTSRFLPWLLKTGSFDKRLSLGLFSLWGLLLLLSFFLVPLLQERSDLYTTALSLPAFFFSCLAPLLFLVFALLEPDPTKGAKKPLVMTQRARRILKVSLLLAFLGGLALPKDEPLLWIAAVQALPFLLCLSNKLLEPFERRVRHRFMQEAKTRLAAIDPLVVGITGSFGKTSVKHILGNLLDLNAKAYFTPGSVNTLMGISRVIRENLPDPCRFFVVEMGAYGKGSIARLCGLTPPKLGLITALGEAHVERFKNLDTVARAKFELAQAVLANPEGKMIVHDSLTDQTYAQAFIAKYRARFILCGASDEADAKITKLEQTAEGLALTLQWNGASFDLKAPLFGTQHGGNIALAFVAAVTLGIAPERAAAALALTPQIAHRLEVKPRADGSILIDDAYNSNPVGFAAALDILELLGKKTGGRRILATPGLVEMGDQHADVHRRLGALAAQKADVILAVAAARIPTFLEGARAQSTDAICLPCADLTEAMAWINANLRANDIVLLENDLPDLYERRLTL